MKTKFFLLSFVLVSSLVCYSQNDIDAMRYSQITFGGTARFASMAGSMGALGGDISTLSFNPAGIAIFRKSELSISPSLFAQTTSSSYNNTSSQDGKLNFNLGNIGLVATIKMKEDNKSGWQSLNFGIGYNRKNNFNNRISIQGDNKTSSLLDTYVTAANGYTSSDFDGFSTNLAYQAFLINPLSGDSLHYNHVIKNYGEQQKKSITTKGSMGETVLSFGGNYKNRVFVGVTLGIVNAKYVEESTYEEIDVKDTIKNFKSFSFTQNVTSVGTGLNLKIGAIVKATEWLRLGAAFHSPTSISMSDNYSSSIKSDLENGIKYSETSPLGKFDYNVTTPLKAIGSVGFIINKIGLLNVDYEYVNYPSARLSSKPNVFSDVNSTIKSKYTSNGNLRVGGEVRFDPIAVRLGYALYGSPFKSGENMDANRTSYTLGLGFRQDSYFIDMAYIFTKYTEYNYLYDPSIVAPVKNDYRSSSLMLSLGVRF